MKKSFREYEVEVYTNTKVVEIGKENVIVERGVDRFAIPAKTVVLAFGYKPNDSLAKELEGVCPVKVIGGSVKTSTALYATRDAFEAIMSL